jgi:adenylate cyclase
MTTPPKTDKMQASSAAKSQDKNEKKLGLPKWLSNAIELLKSPITVGTVITLIFGALTYIYYDQKGRLEIDREQQHWVLKGVYNTFAYIDQKNMDLRFLVRGFEPPPPQVGLLTIDDRSIEEVGRWPWSREKIAFVVDEMMKYGASAIGFDIVFSEPQVDRTLKTLADIEQQVGSLPPAVKSAFDKIRGLGEPDLVLAATLSKNKEKLILGAFNEESHSTTLRYQDYCRNEAFSRANANKFVKIENVSFIVEDVADPFVDVEFSKVFEQIFPVEEKLATDQSLKQVFNKASVTDLEERELRQLNFILEEYNMNYCDRWLTDEDPYVEPLKETYQEIFAKVDLLQGLDLNQTLEKFKKSVKGLPVIQHNRWTINTDLFQEQAAYTGSFNATQDPDGTLRKASMFFRTGNRIGTSYIPSLALQTYLVATGYRADVTIDVDPKHPDQKIITKFEIKDSSKDPEVIVGNVPVDEQGMIHINYSGGRNVYPYLPAKELFNGKETALISQVALDEKTGRHYIQEFEVKKADFIKGRSFIFGATAIGVYDLRVTPFDKNFPGPETHVSALGNLFSQNFIRTHSKEDSFMLWVALGLGILISVFISITSAIPGFLMTVGAFIVIFLVDQYLLTKGLILTMALPFTLVLSLYVFLFFYKYLTEERKKKYLKSTFSKYVSPAVVDEILKDPENIELGGKKMRMSVFFSDVRGFTTISEKLDPKVLSDVLNLYLTPMTELVFQNKGTLDKYMGDAVMAFFGAPIAYPDHAKYACRCALQSIEKLKDVNEKFKALGLDPIDIGVGVNTSEMSVGNMGSDTVRSYTVMGDAVNLGSRLEGITKEYKVRIIISQFTRAEIKDDFVVREVDWVRVKGKNEPIRIFELMAEGKPSEQFATVVKNFEEGFQLYLKKDFRTAIAKFEACLQARPEDGPSLVYIERCHDFLAEPPPENWDGVYVMKTK